MAQPADDPVSRRGAFGTRLVSAVVLAVPVLIVVHVGYPAFDAMVVIGSVILGREWLRMCRDAGPPGATKRREAVVLGLCVLPVLLASGAEYELALVACVACAALAYAVGTRRAWPAAGILYIALPCIALLWLRNEAAAGRELVFWLLAVVWASDIGAYAAGRTIGGWRLAPSLSPNKTWAGFAGGLASSTLVGAGFVAAAGGTATWFLAFACVAMSVAAQAGDLLESSFKRRFGVKDAGGLIPGHGGLLDRVDALMAASVLAALIALLGGGSMGAWLQ